jgi:hypothetical protein
MIIETLNMMFETMILFKQEDHKMTKQRTTVKELNRNFSIILNLGSHSVLDEALNLAYDEASYYHAGGLGWNYDVFVIDAKTCVVTGYRVSSSLHATKCSSTFCKPFAGKIDEIRKATGIGYEAHKEMQGKLRDLIGEFVQAALNQ